MGRICISHKFKKLFVVFIILFSTTLNSNLSAKTTLFKGNFDNFKEENFIILTKREFVTDLKPIEKLYPQYKYFYIPIEDIGSNDPIRVRAYLFSHFNSGYLLIALREKDLEAGTLTISEGGKFSPKTVKSDIFYSIENLDFDNDGKFGEFYDDILKSGLKFRFIVSRLPFENKEDFKKYFDNLNAFMEKRPKVLLASSFISFPNETYDGGKILSGDGARLMELIKNDFFPDSITFYEKGGDFPSIYNCNGALNKENFISASKEATLILWDAHGSQSAAYSEIWLDKNKNGIPENSEFVFTPFVSTSDNFSTNSIVFSLSCLNLQGYDNLGYAFLKNGSTAFIGSREVSYSPSYFYRPEDGGSSSIMYYFVKNLSQGENIGNALYDAFKYFYANLLYADLEDPVESGLLNIYDFNIYGLPLITLNYVRVKEEITENHAKKDLFFDFDFNTTTNEFKITVKDSEPYFVILPKGLFIKNVYYEDSKNSPIFDWFFNIVRSNFSNALVIKGVIRGKVQGDIVVKGNMFENHYSVILSGFDMKDFNFDKAIDDKDFEILKKSFGKTYMNEDFLPQCDLDSNLKIDGIDVLMFFNR
ncbi:MAG: C25 family cysteine peptidase [Caldisericum sp.]|uniref:C25 family cysteine peptidase n=1 Tax=Caldisericum sp. TaxID=2499687 RepID=UPI003D0995C4